MKALIEALRSNTYQQITGQLRAANGFCVIGVACDVADPTKWDEFDSTWDGYGILIPNVLTDHYHQNLDFFRSLMKLNDEQQLTFPGIADYIEAKYAE